jgi:hypothetical protein
MFRHLIITILIVSLVYIGLLVIIQHPLDAEAENVVMGSDVAEVMSDKPQPLTEKPYFKEIEIVGLSANIELAKASTQVQQLWSRINDQHALLNNVNWSLGNVFVYAYYTDFDDEMQFAKLTIGFNRDSLMSDTFGAAIPLPFGTSETFVFNEETQSAPMKAWSAALIHNNLIERHSLNLEGDFTQSVVFVVNPEGVRK